MWVLSTRVEINFVFSLAWYMFGQHMLIYIFVRTGMGCVWSTDFEIQWFSTQAREGFDQYKLRYILCPCWHGMGLVNKCRDAFSVLSVMRCFVQTHVDIHFVSLLVCDGLG